MQTVNLDELERAGTLWRGRGDRLRPGQVLASGWQVLDTLLGGGWPRAALVELISEAHQGLPLLLPALADLSRGGGRLVWVAPPYVPYAPALAVRGVRVERLLLVRDVSPEQSLWATEQALASGACRAVLAWPGEVRAAQLRRLQLAAERGDCSGFLFRAPRVIAGNSPAALRLRVRPVPLGLEVELLKRRGSWGGGACIVPIEGPSAERRAPRAEGREPRAKGNP
jgi:hypothetical protein